MPSYNTLDQKRTRQIVNHDVFAEIDLEQSYWAGFIAADGCIFEIKTAKKKQSKLTIKIKELPFLTRKYKLWEDRGADTRLSHRTRKFTKGLEAD